MKESFSFTLLESFVTFTFVHLKPRRRRLSQSRTRLRRTEKARKGFCFSASLRYGRAMTGGQTGCLRVLPTSDNVTIASSYFRVLLLRLLRLVCLSRFVAAASEAFALA